jgi:hypothetical protein
MAWRALRALGAIATALALISAPAHAQTVPTPAATGQNAPVFKTEELDQIVAPIALYPDDLLAQVLMASSYPLEIVMADRWLEDPNNSKLKGDQLAAAVETQPWDPSVKSLVPFPQVLQMMSDKLDWTQKLGDAILAQQADVMAAVQRLRQRAQAAGTLKTTEQQVVKTEAQTIVIQPANPQVVYVPAYNPTVVYGTWPYPAYPPYYYPPPAYYPGQALLTGMAFATGAAIVGSLWGWGDCNWGGNNININNNRFNQINANNIRAGRATTANGNSWRHDPSHRKGVAYRDQGTRQKYLGQRGNASAAARDFRGYGGQAGGGQRLGGNRQPGGGQGLGGNRQPGGGQGLGGNRQPGGGQGLGGNRPPGGGQGLGAGGQRGTGAGRPQTRQPEAFGGMGSRSSDVRRQANRGAASRGGISRGGGARMPRTGGGRR